MVLEDGAWSFVDCGINASTNSTVGTVQNHIKINGRFIDEITVEKFL
ncbi:hypothetical protein ACFL1X_07345 [Candidatus Hydrogenedentota bacterium]